MLNLVVKIERKHLPDDPNWADSDDEDDEPDESIFEEQLKEYAEQPLHALDNTPIHPNPPQSTQVDL